MKKSDVDAPRPERSPKPDPREHSIERLLSLLEQAQAGSAELDRLVCPLPTKKDEFSAHWLYEVPGHDGRAWNYVPHYTTSLDAALTLVPEGWEELRLQINFAARACNAIVDKDTFSGEPIAAGSARTPALALCIAALKAQSQRVGSVEPNRCQACGRPLGCPSIGTAALCKICVPGPK